MVASAFKREAIAYHEAVLIGKAIGYTNVVIEGDSRAIINKCKAHSGDKSQVSTHIRNIQREKDRFVRPHTRVLCQDKI